MRLLQVDSGVKMCPDQKVKSDRRRPRETSETSRREEALTPCLRGCLKCFSFVPFVGCYYCQLFIDWRFLWPIICII